MRVEGPVGLDLIYLRAAGFTPEGSTRMADVLEVRLDNGLKVLIQPSHRAPVVSTWVWYRVGSRNERTGITGVSHWVEHMLFKGTEQMAKGDVFRLTAR